MISRGKWLLPVLIFIISFCIFNIGLRYVGCGDTQPNELLPISFIREGNLDFNEFFSDYKDLPYGFRNIRGNIISAYPIVTGILSIPVYLVAHILRIDLFKERYILAMLSSSLISSLSVVFMYLALKQICKQKAAVSFSLIYAFATSVLSVASRGLWSHTASIFFITMTLYLLSNQKKESVKYSGFSLGMAVWSRPANMLIFLPLAIYIFLTHRRYFKWFLLFASIALILLSIYSQIYLGSIIALGQAQDISGFNGRFLSGLLGLLISPSRGLLVFSPIFIFACGYLFYMLFSKNAPAVYRYLGISVVLTVLLYSKWGMWWGGQSFGYRLLTDISPILIVFLAIAWEKIIVRFRYLKIIFIILLLVSVYNHLLGAFIFPAGFNFSPDLIDEHPERLWDFKDTQITRCTNKLFKRGILPMFRQFLEDVRR